MKKTKRRSVCNAEFLPMELVTEVLARLPVKSLVRFWCVCKSWNLLISSSDFASMHLARYHHIGDDDKEENEENTHILQSYWYGRSSTHSRRWMLRSFLDYKIIKSRCYRFLGKKGFDCPVGYTPLNSSVHGLLLLHSLRSYVIDIMLWNPILGKSHKPPNVSIPEVKVHLDLYHANNDYKVLAIGKEALYSVYVYSLSSCTWRRIDNYDISIVRGVFSGGHVQVRDTLLSGAGVQIGNVLFWMVRDSRMVSFDVDNEVFDYIEGKLPPVDSYADRKLVEYRKSVGLVDLHGESVKSCSLWVMDKEQGQGTWTKFHEVDFGPRLCTNVMCFKINGIFIFSKVGTVSSGLSGIELCNIETKHMEVLTNTKSGPYPNGFFSSLFKESLVLL